MLWVIGDVHGSISSYEAICRRLHKQDPQAVTIQVGDMGVGFKGVRAPQCGPNDLWIAGNHDDALVCERCPGNLGDFGVRHWCGYTVFFLRGAFSYDRQYRIEGESWWAYEELTDSQFAEALAMYSDTRPDVVISHDCPVQIGQRWWNWFKEDSSRTVRALSQMFAAHRPSFWAFGHHHDQRQDTFSGTEFICVGELQEKLIRPVRACENQQ